MTDRNLANDSHLRTAKGRHRNPSIDGKRDDVVAALEVDLGISASANDDVLLAVERIGSGRSVDAGTGKERPQDVAALRIVGAEPAVAFTSEHETAGGRQGAAHHGQRRLLLPGDLAGVVVDGGDVAPALFAGNHA